MHVFALAENDLAQFVIDVDEVHTQLDINTARSIVASHIADQPELAGKFKNGMPSRGWAVHLLSARGSRLAEACKEHVNGKKIQFFLESEGLEQASDELLSMLGGNKFSSGKMWKYAATSGPGLAIRKAFANHLARKAAAVEDKKAVHSCKEGG